MQTIRLTLPANHPGQATIEAGLRRFNVLACGRRFGKDIYMMNKVIEPALAGYPAAWGAPTYKMLTENWRAINQLIGPVVSRRDQQEKRLELITGGVIDFWSLDNPDMMRGRKYKRVVFNEAGFVPNLLETWNFIARPTLVDMTGDAFVGGTPKGMNGFWQMYQWGLDPAVPDWACWQMTSYENPHIPKSEIDDMVKTLPEMVVQQEIFAAFLDDAGGVFRRVLAAATAEAQEQGVPGHQYVIGVDWAQQYDFTVLSVIDTVERALVHLERFNQVDYVVQSNRLRGLCGRFKPDAIVAEMNSIGMPIIERLQRDGLPIQPFTTTNASKTAAVDALALAFEQSDIRILPDPVLLSELQAYQMERLPSGLRRFSAPEGLHDDCVMSLAMAWYGLGRKVDVVDDPFAGW
jgi:hypothetical protein